MTSMSRENVSRFFELADGNESLIRELTGADAETVVRVAARHELEFDEADLRSTLKEIIYAAQRLPHGFGWSLARDMGLVRS